MANKDKKVVTRFLQTPLFKDLEAVRAALRLACQCDSTACVMIRRELKGEIKGLEADITALILSSPGGCYYGR